MFMLRFDMRCPDMKPQQIAAQYRAALEMAKWADDKGPFMLNVSEHHTSEDGYLPAPLVLASALSAVTSRAPIMVAAALLPLYDPIRLAEEMIVLDHVSAGRVSYVLGLGYRPEEYALFDLPFAGRGALADKKLSQLLATFERAAAGTDMPRVTPPPLTPGRPMIFWGGGSRPAARRAARHGLGFIAQAAAPELADMYKEACAELGREPGICVIPAAGKPSNVFIHPDPDEAWDEIGSYLLHEALAYAAWNRASGNDAVNLTTSTSVRELREENGSYRIVNVDDAAKLVRAHGQLTLHPLCGGIPADIAWRYLRRAIEEVPPAVTTTNS